MANNNWPIENTAEDYFRQTRKRLDRIERIAAPISVPDLLGPGMSSQAVNILDWNDEIATFNGFYFSLIGAYNAPVVEVQPVDPDTGMPDDTQPPVVLSALTWTGQVIAREDGTGMQQVWNTDDPDSMYFRVRNFWPNPLDADAPVVFGEWQKFATPSGFVDGGDLAPPVQDAIGGAWDTAHDTQDLLDAELIRIDGDMQAIVDATTAADEALQDQIDALDDVFDGQPQHIRSTVPPGVTPNTQGTIWDQYDTLTPAAGTSAKLLASWVGNGGTAWTPVSLAPVYIPKIDINTGTVANLQANRLLISDITNLNPDPGFAFNWTYTGQSYVDTAYLDKSGTASGVLVLWFGGTGGTAISTNAIPAKAGEDYSLQWDYIRATSGDGNYVCRLDWYNAAGAYLGYTDIEGNSVSTVPTTWTTKSGHTVAPVNTAAVKIHFERFNAPTAGYLIFDRIKLQRRHGGELIVDGAVQAQHFTGTSFNGVVMTSALFQTHAAANTGIKIISSASNAYGSLIGYGKDPSGNRRVAFSLNGETGDILLSGSLNAVANIYGSRITGSRFSTQTGFDDIDIVPGDAVTPATFQFFSDGPYYDSTSPARISCFDSVLNVSGTLYDTFNVRFQGAKFTSSGATPRIDIGSWRRQFDGAVYANVDYHAGATGGGAGAHTFYIDGAVQATVQTGGVYIPTGKSLGIGIGPLSAASSGIYAMGNIKSSARMDCDTGFFDWSYAGGTGGPWTAQYNNNGRIIRGPLVGSSRRYKDSIETLPLSEAQALLLLRSVTHTWKPDLGMDERRTPGLIAEEVHAATGDLWVTYYAEDDDAEPVVNGVKYPELTAGLLVLVQNHEKRIRDLEVALERAR